MKYIRYWFDIGYHTGDDELYEEFPDNVTKAEIENYGSISFLEHCEDHESLLMMDYEDENLVNDEWLEAWEEVISNCCWGYEEISKEEYEEAMGEFD